MGLERPESKDLPSSRVTVEPTLMVRVVGLKAKLPLLSLVMLTIWPLPALVAVGVVPVVGVGVEPEPEGVLPQAAKRTSAPSASSMSHQLGEKREKA